MRCPTCKSFFAKRTEFIIHSGSCSGQSTNRSKISDESDFDSPADDTDEDPNWTPTKDMQEIEEEEDEVADYEPLSSPLTSEQKETVKELQRVFEDSSPMHTREGVNLDIRNIIFDQENCASLTEDPVEEVNNATVSVNEQSDVQQYSNVEFQKSKNIEKENDALKERIKELEAKLRQTSKSEEKNCEASTSNPEPCQSTEQILTVEDQKKEGKKYFCPFCRELVGHFARHLINKHKTENEVIEISALDVKSDRRKKLIANIRGRGCLIFNTTYELNKGKLILSRRRKTDLNIKKMKPCINCKNYYLSSALYKHFRICTGKPNTPRDLQSKSSALSLENSENKYMSPELKQILPGMDKDEIFECIMDDEAIIEYGNYLCVRHSEKHLKNMIRSKIRLLSKLTIKMKNEDPRISCLDDALTPVHYDTFLKAVKLVAGFENNKFGSPSVVGELGRNMKLVANRRIIHFIKTNNEDKKRDAEKWLHIYSHDYYNTIGRNALRSVQKDKWGKIQLLPLTEDIMKLNLHIKTQVETAVRKLNSKFNKESYNTLIKGLMSDIQIFNRRRALEVEMLQITDFEKRHSIQKGTPAYESLSESEKLVSSKFMRIESRGKLHMKPASMLLSYSQIEQIKLILKFRRDAGVSEGNPYIFANKDQFYKAYPALKELAYGSDAKNPDLLIGTLLRKHIASTVQALNFTDTDMSNLAAFMSHDLTTHRNFYRLPNEAIHLAKLSRLLIALDNGSVSNYFGKSLADIDVNICVGELEEISNECYEQPQNDIEETVEQICQPSEEEQHLVENPESNPSSVVKSNKKKSLNLKNRTTGKKNVKTPTKCPEKKRATWATPERHAARNIFKRFLSPNTTVLPTPYECRDAIRKHKQLQGRTINQLKGWICSERQRIKKKLGL